MELSAFMSPAAEELGSRGEVSDFGLVRVGGAPYRRLHRLSMQEFLDTYAALILRFSRVELGANRYGLDAGDVAHAVIESLLRLHRQGSFEPATLESPEAYLRVVVRRAAQRARVRHRRGGEVTAVEAMDDLAEGGEGGAGDEVPTPEQLTAEARDARHTLSALKRKLRPRDAAAFALLVEDGLSIEETAAALGTTANNVYQMRHRILAAARELTQTEGHAAALLGGSAR